MNAKNEVVVQPLNPLFRMAVLAGVENAVQMHLRRGDNPNARDAAGMTPLMLAASKNKATVCALLLSSGADPLLIDPKGRDALAIAKASVAPSAEAVLAPYAHRAEGPARDLPTEGGGCLDDAAHLTNEDDSAFDLSGWEAEEDGVVPESDASVSEAAGSVHEAISSHILVDSSQSWGDLDTFLPERATPLPKGGDEDGHKNLLQILRRAIREGGVPENEVLAISDNDDGTSNEAREALLRLVLGDLGAETDERLEPQGSEGVWEERDFDEEDVSEALAFLDDMDSGCNDPMRLYVRDMRGDRLLTANEEAELGRRMEDGISAAIDALSRWPVGLEVFVASIEQVRSGELDVGTLWEGLGAEGDDSAVETDEREEPEGEIDGPSLAVKEFLDRAAVVQTLTPLAIGAAADAQTDAQTDAHSRPIHSALVAIKLSPPFLVKLGEEAAGGNCEASDDFRRSLGKYAAARERMIRSNLRLVISVVKRYQGFGLSL